MNIYPFTNPNLRNSNICAIYFLTNKKILFRIKVMTLKQGQLQENIFTNIQIAVNILDIHYLKCILYVFLKINSKMMLPAILNIRDDWPEYCFKCNL